MGSVKLGAVALLASFTLGACEASETPTPRKQLRVVRSPVEHTDAPAPSASARPVASSALVPPSEPPPLDVPIEWGIDEGHDAPSNALAKSRELVTAHETRALRWDIECAPGDRVHRGDEVIARLIASKLRVVSLRMPHCDVTDVGLAALMRSSLAPSLESLDLEDSRFGTKGAEAIATASVPALRSLDLAYNSIGPKGATALAGGGPYPRLETLDLGVNAIQSEGGQAIARSLAFPSLTALDLRENTVGDDTAEAIASADHDHLSSLVFSNDAITDPGALALAGAPWMKSLKAFDLTGNDIEDRGALALGAAMASGSELQMDDNRVSAAGVSAVQSQAKVSFEYQEAPLHRVPPKTIHLAPPQGSDLPATVEIAHMHLWSKECGFDYPLFMPYGPPYGNGGGRDFHWDDIAAMTVYGQFVIADEHPNEVRETRVGDKIVMTRELTVDSVVIHAEFSFDPSYEAYFRPLAKLVFASLRHEK